MALELQRPVAGLHFLRLGEELAASLTFEEVELAGEGADDQVEVTVSVLVDRERSGADVVDPVLPFAGLALDGDDQRLAVGALEDLGLAERLIYFALSRVNRDWFRSCSVPLNHRRIIWPRASRMIDS